MKRRVLYIRDDGELAAEVGKLADGVRQRTHEKVSTASVARKLLWAALECPKVRRQAGVP